MVLFNFRQILRCFKILNLSVVIITDSVLWVDFLESKICFKHIPEF